MKKKLLLVACWLTLVIFLSGCVSSTSPTGSFFPTPIPTKPPQSGRYCLTQEELEAIKAQPIAFTCNRTEIDGTTIIEKDVPYVLAAEDIEVKQLFIHEQKQLILKENCHGVDYYTWKCHPPSWGSIYANTLWKLKDADPNRKPLKNGDHFDVYLKKDAKDTEKFVCKDGASATAAEIFSEPPMAGILEESPLKDKIIRIEDKSALWYMRSDTSRVDIETAPPRRKVTAITLGEVVYDVFVNLLKAFSPDEDKNLYLVPEGVLPEGNEGLPESIIYDQFAILTEVKPKGLSLQLGTFNPFPPTSRWFDIYLPESKPVIYLYPEEPVQLTVKIEPKDGYITVSDPPYDPATGWQVFAYPDGKIQVWSKGEEDTPYLTSKPNQQPNPNLQTYSYFYYESEVKGYQIPQEGFVVDKEKLDNFFQETLPRLGLNQKETADFSEYWLGRFEEVDKPYVFITFIPQNQIEQIDSISISPLNTKYYIPDTIIRIRAYFLPLEKPIEVENQVLLIPPKRQGFTLVEWGGILGEQDDKKIPLGH